MAPKPKKHAAYDRTTNPAEVWACEGCGAMWEGVSPPDACNVCTHEYFESVADILTEGRARDKH